MPDSVLTPELLAELRAWEGRSETLRDEATAAPVRNLSATLDRDDPLPQAGTELPPLWHWLYFLPGHRQGEIGPDGHARRGGFLPPVPLPRRMWASGRYTMSCSSDSASPWALRTSCRTITNTRSPLRPDLGVTETMREVRSMLSPTRSGACQVRRPPAHMRRGSGTGGRNSPRAAWPSGPACDCRYDGRK